MPNNHALVIGNSYYKDLKAFPKLVYAEKDAASIFSLLTDSSTAIFSEETSFCHLNLIYNRRKDPFAEFFRPIQKSDLVLIYFAGHAEVIGKNRLCLIMQNSNQGELASTGFYVDTFSLYLEEKGINRFILVLDCCRAGKAQKKSEGIVYRGFADGLDLENLSGQGKVIVASAREHQLAHELSKLGHGLFSYYFIRGIENGDAVDIKDKYINIFKLSNYIQNQIEKNHPEIHQEPILSGEDLLGELIVAKNPKYKPTRGLYYKRFRESFKQSNLRAIKEIEMAEQNNEQWIPKQLKIGQSKLEKDEAIYSLTIANMLEKAQDHILFTTNKRKIATSGQDITKYYIFDSIITDLKPISHCCGLEPNEFTHRERIQLILSFSNALYRWAFNGVILKDFRANSEYHNCLYLCCETKKGLQFIMGDLCALEVVDSEINYLEEIELSGELLSKAIRFLYYGKCGKDAIKKTSIFKERWNDNIIIDFSEYLQKQPFFGLLNFKSEIENLFYDEIYGSPIIFSDVDLNFIDDIVNADKESIEEAFRNARPTHLLNERGLWERDVFYFIWNDAQAGILKHLIDNEIIYFSLLSYIPYGTRRWPSAKRRDEHMGIQLHNHANFNTDDPKIVFLGVPEKNDIKKVIHQVFGFSPLTYYQQLSELLDRARTTRRSFKLPTILKYEERVLELKRYRLDQLSRDLFKFDILGVITNDFYENHTMTDVTYRVNEDIKLKKHLEKLDYTFKNYPGLTIHGIKENIKFKGILHEILENENGDELINLEIESFTKIRDVEINYDRANNVKNKVRHDDGWFRLIDKGAEHIIRKEESVLREFKMQISDNAPNLINPAEKKAWEYLEPIVGKNLPKLRSNTKRHRSSSKKIASNNSLIEDSIIISEILKKFQKNYSYWHIITGAAGTGKTTVTANILFKYLEERLEGSFPPCRVLVVAATHFAVDNFVDVFGRVSNEKYVPYRFFTQKSGKLAKVKYEHNKIIYKWCEDHYKDIDRFLPDLKPNQEISTSLKLYREHIEEQLSKINDRSKKCKKNKECSIFIPSHEQWRSEKLICSQSIKELNMLHRSILSKSIDLPDNYDIDNTKIQTKKSLSSKDLYKLFAAEVIASTVDGFSRIPDLWFDMVIIEEASQLRVIQLFKILTQVTRARNIGHPPFIILSGDVQQLPPFMENFNHDEIICIFRRSRPGKPEEVGRLFRGKPATQTGAKRPPVGAKRRDAGFRYLSNF